MTDSTNKEPGRITIRHVAEDAGVSVAAVSKVLRNAYGVSSALKEKVEKSIRSLGYRPNMAARGMRGSTKTIGVLLLDLANPFLPSVIDGVNAAAEVAGFKTMIGVSRANAVMESSLIESMIDFRLDGLMLIAPRLASETLTELAAQIPIVVIGQHFPASGGFDTVNADDRAGARQAVEALVAEGFSDIAMISVRDIDQSKSNAGNQRELGYVDAMTAAGLTSRISIVQMPDDPAASGPAIEAFLTSPRRPRAVFCWSDLHGLPTLNKAHEHGIRVPEDLALIGFDNSPVADMSLINMTSIDQDGAALGSAAARVLFSRIEGRSDAQHVVLPTRLISRGTHLLKG